MRRLLLLGALALATLGVVFTISIVGGSAAPPAAASGDPVIAAAGDIACDPAASGFNGGNGNATDCREKYTAALLTGTNAVLALGDEQYNCGGTSAFQQSYDPTWGAQKAITYPVPGNHEYQSSGGTDCSTNANGYFTYFGANAGDPSKGYYSYNLGAWHLIALNSECSWIGGCGAGSAEDLWLKDDLAANSSAPCTLAYWHRPRFSANASGGDSTYSQLWQDLYAAHADVVLTGHEHYYERFALQNPSAQADANGIREFIVGTGGESYFQPSTTPANSQVVFWGQYAYGVLKMALHAGSYDWTFVPVTGTDSDSGSTACHNAPSGGPDITPPTTTISCNSAVCSTGWYAQVPVTVALSATDSGGSAVATTYYTTDGSDPTTSPTRTAYGGPFGVTETTPVRFYSIDTVGNTEVAKSQTVRIDAAAPQVAITAPVNGASIKRGTSVTVTATTNDNGTGAGAPSGIASVAFYVDGAKVASDTGSPYSFTWRTKHVGAGTHTLTAAAVDVAGNPATSAPVAVTITR